MKHELVASSLNVDTCARINIERHTDKHLLAYSHAHTERTHARTHTHNHSTVGEYSYFKHYNNYQLISEGEGMMQKNQTMTGGHAHRQDGHEGGTVLVTDNKQAD